MYIMGKITIIVIMLFLAVFTQTLLFGNETILPLLEIQKDIIINDPLYEKDIKMALYQEHLLINGKNRIFLTIHKTKPGSSYKATRVTFWECLPEGYSEIERYDSHYDATAKEFAFDRSQFLFVELTDPSAGALWYRNAIYYVDDKGTLRTVMLDQDAVCYYTLPPLSLKDDDSSTRGRFYYFENNKVLFRTNIHLKNDSPNFPTGGRISGKLTIERTEEGLYKLKMIDCQIIKHNK